MDRILVIDENKTLAKLFVKKIATQFEFEFDIVSDVLQARTCFSEHKYILCLIDLSLNLQEEALNLCFENKISSLILTPFYDTEIYEKFSEKFAYEIILKNDFCVDKILESIANFYHYRKRKIILALSNANERKEIKTFLTRKGFEILAAAHGEEVLNYLEFNQDVKMIICDLKMPVIDAYELLVNLRRKNIKSELALLVLSDENNAHAKLLKQDANDVLNKPISKELLFYKIIQNFKEMRNSQILEQYSNIEPISGLKNSYALMKELKSYFDYLKEKQEEFAFAFIDIDKLKSINEEFGYEIGDKVVKQCAKELVNETKGRDIIGRYSPEKFCVLLKNINSERAIKIFSHIRVNIKSQKVADLLDDLYFSVSIGLSFGNSQSVLSEMITKVEKALFEAKNNGGDRVEVCF